MYCDKLDSCNKSCCGPLKRVYPIPGPTGPTGPRAQWEQLAQLVHQE